MQTRDILVLLDAETPETPIDWVPDRLQAWTIFTSLWWERVEDGAIKSANPRAESLANSLEHERK